MKITTKSQLLVSLILTAVVIHSAIAAISWYVFHVDIINPLIGGAVFGIMYQYNVRKNNFNT